METLIKSAKILENKYPNIFKFVIIGGGIEENKLKNMVKKYRLNNVYFTGMIYSTSSLLPQYYASADIFALPTLYEGFGYVFSEAMSFGLPVIGTDTSAVPEVVSGTGIIIPLRSPIKLSQAIYSIYSDSKLRKELSRKSLKKVENWYWDKLIMDYEKFLYEAINKNRKYNNSYKRYKRCFSDLFFDFPKILFIGLRPLYKTKNSWGSILNKRYE